MSVCVFVKRFVLLLAPFTNQMSKQPVVTADSELVGNWWCRMRHFMVLTYVTVEGML